MDYITSKEATEKNGQSFHAGCRYFEHRAKYQALFGLELLGNTQKSEVSY